MGNIITEKNFRFKNNLKLSEKINFQQFFIYASLILILIIATISMAIADESAMSQSFSNSKYGDNSVFSPRGHIEDFSWTKRVSSDGVIEISGIGFSVVNDDKTPHAFEICTIVQGPLVKFTPSLENSLACTITDIIDINEKLQNQSIDFSNGIKVSDLVDISISIQELQ